MRQIPRNELVGVFDDIAQLRQNERSRLDELGIVFAEQTDSDEAGPTNWAAVELNDQTQFLLVEHHAHPEQFIDVRGQLNRGDPRELAARFAEAIEADERVFNWVADGWPRPGT